MQIRRAVTLVVLAAAAAACGAPAAAPPAPAPDGPSAYFGEEPVGSKTWTPLTAEPEWVKNPPARDGYVRVVGESASDLRDIATTKAWPFHANERRIGGALTPIVGDTAARFATKLANSHLTLLARATREEDGPNSMVPGNHFVQAWALWEVAIDDVVADLPADKRDAARAALAKSK